MISFLTSYLEHGSAAVTSSPAFWKEIGAAVERAVRD